jgi:trehalose-phosphatase
MKSTGEEIDLEQFFSSVKEAEHRVLFLDYDGTLAPFVEQRDRAVPYPGVKERLETLVGLEGTRPVIVSGRALRDLIPLLRLGNPPELWGSHGWERQLPGGGPTVFPVERRAKEGLAKAERWLKEKGFTKRSEKKPASIALHWRDCEPEEEQAIWSQAAEGFGPIAALGGLKMEMFDGGVELRVPGRDKGTVVNAVLDEVEGSLAAAYLGDDLTDEDAFRALGDRGLSVLVRPEMRGSEADVWIEPPDELLNFLDQWIEACR